MLWKREEGSGLKKFWNSAGVRFGREMAALFFGQRGPQSAAELAYFLVLTFFPALICVNAIVGLLDLDIQTVLDAAAPFLPQEILGVLGDYIGYITTNQSAALLWAGGLATLVTASAAFRVLMHVMEGIYGRRSQAANDYLTIDAASVTEEPMSSMYNEVMRYMQSEGWQRVCELGTQAWNGGDMAQAEAYYNLSLQLRPEEPETMFLLGRLYQSQDRIEEANALFDRIVGEHPESPYAQRAQTARGY